jgi:histidine triad (HIT) family protein
VSIDNQGSTASDNCLFCKIAAGSIPADIVYQDDKVVAFRDINPQAPIHLLIIPRTHLSTINEASATNQDVLGYLVLVAKQLAADNGVDQSGYRLVMNCNQDGGQTVFHIHLHLLGGRQLTRLG